MALKRREKKNKERDGFPRTSTALWKAGMFLSTIERTVIERGCMNQNQGLTPGKRKRLLKQLGSCPAGYTNEELEPFLDLFSERNILLPDFVPFQMPSQPVSSNASEGFSFLSERKERSMHLSVSVQKYEPWHER